MIDNVNDERAKGKSEKWNGTFCYKPVGPEGKNGLTTFLG